MARTRQAVNPLYQSTPAEASDACVACRRQPQLGRFHVLGMGGAAGGFPDGTEIGQLNLQTLDLQPQCPPARKIQGDAAAGRIVFIEIDGEEIEHHIGVAGRHLLALAGIDPFKPQRGAAALKMRTAATGTFPVEPVEGHDQPFFRWPPQNIADLDDGILEVSRDDLEIVAIEGYQL